MDDSQKLDWLEANHVVICYDEGDWFCAWRGGQGREWKDYPMERTVRAAIQAAINEMEDE